MQPTLNVYALPQFAKPEEFLGGVTVVIDVLRAATTVAYALDAGAKEIIPCLEVSDAWDLAREFDEDQVVLGGERGGLAIDGFQLGNSPSEYTPDRVGGKTVILTTTNGARAIHHARHAEAIYVAALVNASATVAGLSGREKIDILCSGTDGQVTEEDVLLAGLLVDRLGRRSGDVYRLNAQAMTAREFWLHAFVMPQAVGAEPIEPARMAERLRNTPGGRNLVALGFDDDILAAAEIDRFDAASRLDLRTFRIRRDDDRS